MRRTQRKQKFQWRLFSNRDVSVFWKYLCMNICLLLLSVIALIASNQFAVNELTEENLATMQISLEQNTDRMVNTLYQNYAIPKAVENTRYYNYFSGLSDDEPDAKYIPALTFLQNALQSQVALQSANVECLLYLPKTKNICGTNLLYPSAQECFESGVRYEYMDPAEVYTLLQKNHGIVFLPMQEVSIEGDVPQKCLTLVINPVNSVISVMTLYSEQMVLDYIGMPTLPEGTYLRLTDGSGDVVYEYPQQITDNDLRKTYELSSADSNVLGMQVTIWVPQSYFQELLQPSYHIGIALIVLTVLVGLVLSLLFSNVSVMPLRELILNHSAELDQMSGNNELHNLDRLIMNTRHEAADIRNMLAQNLLMRAFSGGILSDTEELELNRIAQLKQNYRVALLHTTEKNNHLLVHYLQQHDKDLLYVFPLNRRECGVLLLDRPELLLEFRSQVTEFQETSMNGMDLLCCGISASAQGLSGLHLAVRQSRIVMPQHSGIEEYQSDRPAASNISWLQHERMYQCIFSNDEEQAIALLEQIAQNTSHHNAMEVFYNIRFVIRCAAEEVDLQLARDQQPEFLPSLLPRENIRRLELMLHQVFLLNQQKHETFADSMQNQILEYLRDNFSDDRLCAGSVSEAFGIPENKAYELVRRATDMSFNEYLLSLRMRKAANLLCSTQDSIRDIAATCGYPAESTFYRVFKKFYGIPPAQYRRGVLSADGEDEM